MTKREPKGTSEGGRFAKDTSGKNAIPDNEPLPAVPTEPTKEDIHELTNVWAAYQTKVPSTITDPNVIAAWIREIDGNHEMGAGELGEEIADRIEKELHRQAILDDLTPEDYAVEAYLSEDPYKEFWASRQAVAGKNERHTRTANRINMALGSFQRNSSGMNTLHRTPTSAAILAMHDAAVIAERDGTPDLAEMFREEDITRIIQLGENRKNGRTFNADDAYEEGLKRAETLARERIPYPEVSHDELAAIIKSRLERGSVQAAPFYEEMGRLGVPRTQMAQVVVDGISRGTFQLSPDHYLSLPE